MEGLLATFSNLDLLWRANGNWGTNCWRNENVDSERSVKRRLGFLYLYIYVFMQKAKSAWIYWSGAKYLSMGPKWQIGRHWSLNLELFKGNDIFKFLSYTVNLKRISVLWAEAKCHLTWSKLVTTYSIDIFCLCTYLWHLHQNKYVRNWLDTNFFLWI